MGGPKTVQDGNVTITRTASPPEKVTTIVARDPPQEFVRVSLSRQAREFLRRKGFSTKFIDALHMMLQEATNKVHNTIIRSPPPAPGSDFSRPDPPRRMKMPANLQHSWIELDHGRGANLMMPDIRSYFPTVPYHQGTYDAFASREGQRFMKAYYSTGWLRQDPKTQEWVVAPPAPLSQVTPRRIR